MSDTRTGPGGLGDGASVRRVDVRLRAHRRSPRDAFFTGPSKTEFLSEMQQDAEAVADLIDDFEMDRVRAVFVAHSHVDHAIDVEHRTGRGVDESRLELAVSGESIEVGDFTVRIEESPHSEIPGVEPPDRPPTIDRPLSQPATNEQFAAGGNFNFIITHGGQTYVVVSSAPLIDRPCRSVSRTPMFAVRSRNIVTEPPQDRHRSR